MSRRERGRRARGLGESGSMTIEAVLVLPLLLWAFAASWVFFDAFRAQAINTRAAYAIGDALSRETGYVTPTYVDSLWALQGMLVPAGRNPRIRVSVIGFDTATNRHVLRWSHSRGTGLPALDAATLPALGDRLPTLSSGEVTTLVETWVDYTPLFDVGIVPFTFEDRATTQLRFAGQLCYSATGKLPEAVC